MHSAPSQPDPADERDERRLGGVIVGLMAVELIIITIILAALGVAGITIALMIVGVTLGTAALIAGLIHWLWNPLAHRFPAQAIHADAVSRSMQSVAVGRFASFNNCVRITVDVDRLHLDLIAPLRVFGARRISIPWDVIAEIRPTRQRGMSQAILENDRRITGPTWALKVAAPESETDPPCSP